MIIFPKNNESFICYSDAVKELDNKIKKELLELKKRMNNFHKEMAVKIIDDYINKDNFIKRVNQTTEWKWIEV